MHQQNRTRTSHRVERAQSQGGNPIGALARLRVRVGSLLPRESFPSLRPQTPWNLKTNKQKKTEPKIILRYQYLLKSPQNTAQPLRITIFKARLHGQSWRQYEIKQLVKEGLIYTYALIKSEFTFAMSTYGAHFFVTLKTNSILLASNVSFSSPTE